MPHVFVLKIVPYNVFAFLIVLGIVLVMSQYCMDMDMFLSLLDGFSHVKSVPSITSLLTYNTKCCLSRLTILLPSPEFTLSHTKRSTTGLTDLCGNFSISLLTKTEIYALGISLVGVPAWQPGLIAMLMY